MENTPKAYARFWPETLAAVDQINVHGYYKFEPDANRTSERRANTWHRREVRALADGLGKKLWQSEAGPMNFKGGSELHAALQMALNLIMDVNMVLPGGYGVMLCWFCPCTVLTYVPGVSGSTLFGGDLQFASFPALYVHAK